MHITGGGGGGKSERREGKRRTKGSEKGEKKRGAEYVYRPKVTKSPNRRDSDDAKSSRKSEQSSV